MFELSGDETHSRDDDFVCWTNVPTNQMNLVGDKQFHSLNILSLLPAPRDQIPLSRCRKYNITSVKKFEICGNFSGKSDDFLPTSNIPKLLLPVRQPLIHHFL